MDNKTELEQIKDKFADEFIELYKTNPQILNEWILSKLAEFEMRLRHLEKSKNP